MMNKSIIKNESLFYNIFAHGVFVLFCIGCILPLLLVLGVSLSDEYSVAVNGFHLIPEKISFKAYTYVLSSSGSLLNAYLVTIFVTVTGTCLSLLITSMFAYPISRKVLKYRNKVALFIFFPMLFNGGLVPWYILISRYLHLKDTILVMIIPYLVISWYVLLMRNFFATIPDAMIESARIDGAGELRTFFRIVIPLSLPAIATIGLFSTLLYWNDWWLSLLFIENRSLMPLQYLLQSILMNIEVLISNPLTKLSRRIEVPSQTARMAMCIIAIGPIIFAYPFYQKYFIKGLTIGAIKG